MSGPTNHCYYDNLKQFQPGFSEKNMLRTFLWQFLSCRQPDKCFDAYDYAFGWPGKNLAVTID